MIILVIILLIISVYFSARFYLLSNNIKKLTLELNEICSDIERNRRLVLESPNRDLELLLDEINNYLEKTQLENIKHIRKEKEIKEEIENISHDLRTPITSILGYLELMKDKDTTEDEKEEYIEIIEKKSKTLCNLIQSFYDLCCLQSYEYYMNMVNVDIHKALMEQLLTFYNDFEERNIDVRIDLGKEPVNILCDTKIMQRVFDNLIQNAIKYSNAVFGVYLKNDDSNINIIFYNDIKEIDENFQVEKLFNRFYMKDNSRGSNSSGLGLTIVKLLIEKMNGEIEGEIRGDFIYFKLLFKK